ncbi:vesicle-associated protein 1-3-like [Impatiens glandulifera]|uniref:vesicle-associated protein 1-3-like n=1 Tax=Impatiens glandulifera TaxID=253017 RepID=UPI001FB076C5|nr:vesicle-associated protein 1-3-like [Impatiens glandulifera]
MSSADLLNVQPPELKFPVEPKKQSSCSLTLTNTTDKYVAFKIKTTNPKNYCVRPNNGVVLPGSPCIVTVTMQAQKEAPLDLQCKDKFLIQSVIAPDGIDAKDVTAEMFEKAPGKIIGDFKVRVVYLPANNPSPIQEGSEDGSSPRASVIDNGNQASLPDSAFRSSGDPLEKASSGVSSSIMSKLMEEKELAIQQNMKLHQELELLRNETGKKHGGGFSVLFVVLFGLIGILIGYLLKQA